MASAPDSPDGEHAAGGPMIVFGPVPSRRLGNSLGVNNIPPKVCTYSCAYCQVGRTLEMVTERRAFHGPELIAEAVARRLAALREAGQPPPDYLSFVPDGEPTLDRDLGRTIERLRPLGIPIAVVSNASLVWRPDVRADLARADWVSLKVDTVDERTWRRLDAPHRSLELEQIQAGMLQLREAFTGELVTETMLVAGHNDDEAGVEAVARFVARLQPATAYLSIPTRPPARQGVRAPDEAVVVAAHRAFAAIWPRVELLTGYEGSSFAAAGSAEESLLAITAVHPMRRQAVQDLLARSGADWSVVERLVAAGQLVATEHDGHTYYLRRYARKGGRGG